MNKFKVGDVVWWAECGMKLTISRINNFKSHPYSCTDSDGNNWNWFDQSELKPIRKEYAILGDA